MENRLVVAKSSERGAWGVTANVHGVSVVCDEVALKLDNDVGCTSLWIE